MALFNGRIEGSKVILEGTLVDIAVAKRLVQDAVEDIAEIVEERASREAPEDTGILKANPVDRVDTFGVVTGVPSFGNQVSVRGAGGRFTGAVSTGVAAGELIFRSAITVAEKPFYAKYVHDGSGVYGPAGKPYTAKTPGKQMHFYYHKGRLHKHFKLSEVRGQRKNPYLIRAFIQVQGTYIPERIRLLRSEIAAAT